MSKCGSQGSGARIKKLFPILCPVFPARLTCRAGLTAVTAGRDNLLLSLSPQENLLRLTGNGAVTQGRSSFQPFGQSSLPECRPFRQAGTRFISIQLIIFFMEPAQTDRQIVGFGYPTKIPNKFPQNQYFCDIIAMDA